MKFFLLSERTRRQHKGMSETEKNERTAEVSSNEKCDQIYNVVRLFSLRAVLSASSRICTPQLRTYTRKIYHLEKKCTTGHTIGHGSRTVVVDVMLLILLTSMFQPIRFFFILQMFVGCAQDIELVQYF